MKRTTSLTELLVRIDRKGSVPFRHQLERELRHTIQSGRLPAGAPLPSTRTLAQDLALSRGVVVEAYEQLLAEGYLHARRGSGTRVAPRRRIDTPPRTIEEPRVAPPRDDFRPGLPDLRLFPRRSWVASVRRALATAPDEALDYPDARGVGSARAALAAYLNRARATVATADRVVFANGSSQGINVLCRVLRDRGVRRIAVEDPGHADQCTDIRSLGLETPRIPVDSGGLVVERLTRLDVGAVLVTPAHQYPTGAVLTAERRTALLDWATRRHAIVIEDDYDAEYRYDREPIGALQGMAPDRVAYVGSASKVLSPALRLGWLVLPPDLVDEVTTAKRQDDRGSPAFEQLAFADFLNRGEFDRHLRRTREVYRRRRDALVDALRRHLPHLKFHGVAAGLHVMLELDQDVDETALVADAASRSIRVYGARAYRANPAGGQPALVVGYGGLREAEIPEAVRRLASVLAVHGEPHAVHLNIKAGRNR
jgi:GntR family transcriptional regulator / MocR family aminotransferase